MFHYFYRNFYAIELWFSGVISWSLLWRSFLKISSPPAIAGIGGSYQLGEEVYPIEEDRAVDRVRGNFEKIHPIPYSIKWNGEKYVSRFSRVSRFDDLLGESEAETMNEWFLAFQAGWDAREKLGKSTIG